jgi:Rrf2 family protein
MKISTKGCYGLRAMVDLAQHQGEGPILLREIAGRQGLSRKYLHALLTSLRAAGLVRSVRGSGGGYLLAQPPGKVSIFDVLHALEGPLEVADCVRESGSCPRSAACAGHDMWAQLSRALADWLRGVTLADLTERQVEKRASPSREGGPYSLRERQP